MLRKIAYAIGFTIAAPFGLVLALATLAVGIPFLVLSRLSLAIVRARQRRIERRG